MLRPDGTHAPTGGELAHLIAKEFQIDCGEVTDLSQIAQAVVNKKGGRKELEGFIKSQLSDLTPDEKLRWLFSLRWRAIYTTNYDNVIERAYELSSHPPQRPVSISITNELTDISPLYEVPVYHLHGTLFGVATPHIIVTEDDYLHFREKRRMLFELLKLDTAISTILFIGYSNRDPNWKLVREEILIEYLPSEPPISYRVTPITNPLEEGNLRAKGIETVKMDLTQFAETTSIAIAASACNQQSLEQARNKIPSDLSSAFEDNPPATVRLLSSWTYLNQGPFSDQPNLQLFLEGDRANWPLIGSRMFFQRDLEDQLYDELLDFATSGSQRPVSCLILAPAGYGITTLLMTVAVRLVKEKAGHVFFLNPGANVVEGDIDYASSLFPGERPFFIVDNASDHRGRLDTCMRRLRDQERPAMILAGARLNEWRSLGGAYRGKEYQLEPLSESEIELLLVFLEKHHALGKLTDLPHGLRMAAVRSKHGKELLVAMKEATEGENFDAIIENEYRKILNEKAQLVYLIVCCFHQHGAFVRDTLLAEIAQCSLTDLYSSMKGWLEGVVITECLNEQTGAYCSRARHRKIAEIIWHRCGDRTEKELLLQKALNGLNINIGIDKAAFEEFVRADSVIDEISTLEGKIKFFDSACRKDPDSPYVFQHYARMFMRAGKHQLALDQIGHAIDLTPGVRVLYHTKGKVLSEIAMSTENPDMARRRITQSEQAFRKGLTLKKNDEYCYQGLAELYFGWAKRAPGEDEGAEYLTKAEDTITEGLKTVGLREGLWVVTSQIAHYLGDSEGRRKALEKAVQESPQSIIGRYMLGRMYRKRGEPSKAIEVLERLLADHPEQFRASVEYARALIDIGQPYTKAIAALRLSSSDGYKDARYIATLGGMLFLNNDFTDAEIVFKDALNRTFTQSELNTVLFKPRGISHESNSPFLLRGKIIVVKSGYALIDAPNYPTIICPGSKWHGVVLRKDMYVDFQLVFTPRGQLAVNPVPVEAITKPSKTGDPLL